MANGGNEMLQECYPNMVLSGGDALPNTDITLAIDAGNIAKTKSKFIYLCLILRVQRSKRK